ncbi:MAG: helix-turn-helix domain-containing protein [Candidatus Gastranaerophilaceae bacterium]
MNLHNLSFGIHNCLAWSLPQHIKPENYSRIENGLSFPKLENIVKISKVLDVEIAELFQFSHLNDYDKILKAIIEKLQTDKETTVITYKFLKSLGKI